MAISNLTITTADLEGKKISDIVGDTLVGTPAENKAKFDDYSEVIKEKFNALIDKLGEFLSSSGVGAGDLSDTIKLILENGAEYYVPKLNANNKIESKYITDATTSDKGVVTLTDAVTSGEAKPPTSGAVYSAIQTVAGVGANIRDYVIQYSFDVAYPSITWSARRWESGIAECWGYTTEDIISCVDPNKYGNAYYSTEETIYFPQHFFIGSPAPKVSATAWSHGGLFDIAIDTWDKDQIKFYYYSPKSEARRAGASFYVIGRWK